MHDLPSDLLLDFFVKFARFEYALKRARYLEKKPYASPDWQRFADDLRGIPAKNQKAILDCAAYLQTEPPKKQVVADGALRWEERKPSDSQIQSVIESVKTVRNNLFHGGKFPEGPIAEPARNQRLLNECLAVLQAVLDQPVQPAQKLARFFNEGFRG